MSAPRLRVQQTHMSRPRSASPVRGGDSRWRPASPTRGGASPTRPRFYEYAPGSREAVALFRGPKRFALHSRLRVRSLFAPLLPAGYPDSVTPDYLPFQLWDSVQGLCSYIRGSFTTAALLKGVGVGSADAEATALNATAVYLARDWCGHAFGLLFAVAAAGKLDAEAKQWRFAADCANGLGYVLELLSPSLPKFLFLPSVILSALLRAFCGVAAGATRAALTSHFALAHNVADVSAKEGSQETAVTLLGMLVGYLLVRFTAEHGAAVQWALFLAISALHLFANAKAMRALRLTSLNRERLTMLVWHYEFSNQQILSVAEVAQKERLLPQLPHWLRHRVLQQHPRVPCIRLGVPLAPLLGPGMTTVNAADFAPGASEEQQMFFGGLLPDSSWTASFAFHRRATSYNLAGALVRAVSAATRGRLHNAKDYRAALHHPRIVWEDFAEKLRAKGWNLGRIHLSNDEGWRFDVR